MEDCLVHFVSSFAVEDINMITQLITVVVALGIVLAFFAGCGWLLLQFGKAIDKIDKEYEGRL